MCVCVCELKLKYSIVTVFLPANVQCRYVILYNNSKKKLSIENVTSDYVPPMGKVPINVFQLS